MGTGCNNSGKNLTAIRAVRFENLTALTKFLTALIKNLSDPKIAKKLLKIQLLNIAFYLTHIYR